MDEEEKIVGIADRIIKLWPLMVLIVGGISGYLKLKWTVDDVMKDQEEWKRNSESRRERTVSEFKNLELDVRELKTNVEWLKRGKQ